MVRETSVVRVLGVDLAAAAATTGAVVIVEVSPSRWRAEELDGPADDDRLVDVGGDVDVIGCDAPLGWPVAFVESVQAHGALDRWPGSVDRSTLTHRDTDRAVRRLGFGSPLSVSADKLGSVAMRCALLQHRWALEAWGAPAPRDGTGRLVEAYPAAALVAWKIECRGYKDRRNRALAAEVRDRTIDSIAHATAHWLDASVVRDRCVASDHVLDALVCALVAIAARSQHTYGPSEAERPVALVEGWIHVPSVGLGDLAP